MNMNINQHYGCLDLPSQIVDSFDHQDTLNNLYEKNNNMNQGLNKSEYVNDFNEKIYGFEQMQSGIGLDSSVEDTFLANLPVLVGDKQANKPLHDSNNIQISVSKTKILRNALPSQQLTQYIQIINSCENSIILNIVCPVQIQILSSQCYERVNKNYENKGKQFYLDAWQKIQVGFKIRKDDQEFGDVFQTIIIDYRAKDNKNINGMNVQRKKKTYIEVQVHYITPKMAITYEGCSDVTTISLNKVSMNKIGKNKFGEYCLNVGVVGVQRLECTIETRGNLKVFPNELILYKDEKNKITFKPTSNAGALIMKAKNAKVCFVFGVQLI